MPITQAQYDFMVSHLGTQVADANAAQAGGVVDVGGVVEIDQQTGQAVGVSYPDAFYEDYGTVEAPVPSEWQPTFIQPPQRIGPPASSMVPVSPVLPAVDPRGLTIDPDVAAAVLGTGVTGGGVGEAALGIGGGAIGIAAAIAALRVALRGATRVTQAHWNSLPGWARTALAAVGIGVGYELAQDLPGVPGGGFDLPFIGGSNFPAVSEVLGVQVVGSWDANGVRFYRLSDGKLAVQNKMGRWKVWRPKKPIVLYSTGAADIPTLLRADAALNRQSKKIKRMLGRRAPTTTRKRAASSGDGGSTTVTNVK